MAGVAAVVGGLVPTNGWATPPGRMVEMVSPAYKGGYDVGGIEAVDPSGNRVVFYSRGMFANTPGASSAAGYMATRGASQWSTVSLAPPAEVVPDVLAHDFSPSLESSLVLAVPPSPNVAVSRLSGENRFWLHETLAPGIAGSWQAFGPALANVQERPLQVTYVGASSDFCHLLVEEGDPMLPLPGIYNEVLEIYEVTRGCDGSQPSLRMVGVDNHDEGRLIDALCGVEVGAGPHGSYTTGVKDSAFNAIADGGSVVFFTAGVEEVVRAKEACPDHQLFARLDGVRTIEVSRDPEAGKAFGGCEREGVGGEVPCAGADLRVGAQFAGASEDGTVVFFTRSDSTETSLPSELYMAKLGCPLEIVSCPAARRELLSVAKISVPAHGLGQANVRGVVRVAPDGSRIYYVAAGVLSQQAGGAGQSAIEGADNLYVYDAKTGITTFIADLCSGSERSGSVRDSQCPARLDGGQGSGAVNDSSLWSSTAEAEVQTGGLDGRFLVFASYGRLTTDDVDAAKDVYRYDATTDELIRVSTGAQGADANGNDDAFDATIAFGHEGGAVFEQNEMDDRALSEDGSRIVFRTAGPLAEGATDGLVDVYEWRAGPGSGEGQISMVSCGCSTEGDTQAVVSASGADVFFTTAAGLARQDTDGLADVYDAHECSASVPCFVPTADEPEPCEGEGCQEALSRPASLLAPASVVERGTPSSAAATHGARMRKGRARHRHLRATRKRRGRHKRADRPMRHMLAGGRQ